VTYRFNTTPNNGTDTVPPGTRIRTNTAPLVIGKISHGGSVNSGYEGLMDELRIVAGDSVPTESQLLCDAGQHYWPTGQVTSTILVPAPGERWLRFEALDHRPAGTRIVYSILDENGELLLYPVLPGSDISSFGNVPIQLHAELATEDPAVTPVIYEWSLQTEPEAAGVPPEMVPLAAVAFLGPGRLLLGFLAIGLLASLALRRRWY
jgi:hypothetical protein